MGSSELVCSVPVNNSQDTSLIIMSVRLWSALYESGRTKRKSYALLRTRCIANARRESGTRTPRKKGVVRRARVWIGRSTKCSSAPHGSGDLQQRCKLWGGWDRLADWFAGEELTGAQGALLRKVTARYREREI